MLERTPWKPKLNFREKLRKGLRLPVINVTVIKKDSLLVHGILARWWYGREIRIRRGSEWGVVFSVICPQFLVFAVKLANFLMLTVSEESTVKCLEGSLDIFGNGRTS